MTTMEKNAALQASVLTNSKLEAVKEFQTLSVCQELHE